MNNDDDDALDWSEEEEEEEVEEEEEDGVKSDYEASDDFRASDGVGDNQEEGVREGQKIYRNFSNVSNTVTDNQKLAFVERILISRDRKYVFGFLVVVGICLIMLIKNSMISKSVPGKAHMLLGMIFALATTGLATAAMMQRHYRLSMFISSQSSSEYEEAPSTAFSFENLKYVLPLEMFCLCSLTLLLWVDLQTVTVISIVPLFMAFFDANKLANATEKFQFASIMFDIASELVATDKDLSGILRVTWSLFAIQLFWFMLWTYVFVDNVVFLIYHNAYKLLFIEILFLLFALFWTAQVARSFLSYYVTGSVCHKLLSSGDSEVQRPSVSHVQGVLFSRGCSIGFGSICRGALAIGPVSVAWGTLEFLRLVRSWLSKAMQDNASARRLNMKIATKSIAKANRYAWGRVSLRGNRFLTASQGAWDTIQASGVDGAIESDAAETILKCWSWIFGALTAILSHFYMSWMNRYGLDQMDFWYLFASFCLGAANSSLLMEPLRATLSAFFVSYSEDTKCLEKQYPILHHRLTRLCEMARYSPDLQHPTSTT